LAHNVQLTVDKGIGFGGAGKNVTQGGNQVSTITARTTQNPQGTTSSFAGRPTTQDLEKAIPKDWAQSDDEFSDDINEDIERYVEALERAGYDIVTESATACPECGGPAYSNSMLAEKQDACYHKVKSRYKVWPSAYASGALVRCRKVGANNWGNKSKK
jgi:Asp-tRNA(Asn)/Glu-tRNA(Gln) amidotransferase A subunit family amidase